jgi:hypothetical protein
MARACRRTFCFSFASMAIRENALTRHAPTKHTDISMRHGEITLTSGRQIYLKTLLQEITYDGLLEGAPTVEMNNRIIERHMKSSSAGSGLPPYLIVPVERPIEYDGKYPFGTPASLPIVVCIGRFTSLSPARDKTQDYSSLRIIWFQDDFVFPIAPDVLHKITNLPWDDRAHDLQY